MAFLAPRVTTPQQPKAAAPAPRVDAGEMKAKEQARQVSARFGQEDTLLTLGRTRQRQQVATMLGRSAPQSAGATGSMGY